MAHALPPTLPLGLAHNGAASNSAHIGRPPSAGSGNHTRLAAGSARARAAQCLNAPPPQSTDHERIATR
eukprot:8160065-Lingulodinium_polyedra.AAC.1